MAKFAKKKNASHQPPPPPLPLEPKSRHEKKGGHLVAKMVKKIFKILTQLRFIHNWVLTDIQWMMSTGFHLQTFFIQPFSSNLLDDGPTGWPPRKVDWYPLPLLPLIPKSLVQSGRTGPVRSDRSSQTGPKSGNIWNLGT